MDNVRFKLGDWERDAMSITVKDCEFVFRTMNIDLMAKAFSVGDKASLIKNLLGAQANWLAMVRIVFPDFTVDEFMNLDAQSIGEFLVDLQMYCIGCMTGIEHPNKDSKPVKKKSQ